MSYNDTSRAWKALNKIVSDHDDPFEEDPSIQPTRYQKQISTTENGHDCNQNQEENPMLLYCAKRELKRDEDCHYCGTNVSLKGALHGCRICDKIFHRSCLERKCFLNDELSIEALGESENEVGWSCPTCEDIFSLLDENEKNHVIEAFDEMVGNETSVDVKRYLEHRRESYRNLVGIDMSAQREGQEIRIFEEIDSDHSGTIEWWEYARSTCMRLLSRRKQEDLLELITPREVARLESFFKKYDKKETGVVTLSIARVIYGKWMLSLVKGGDSMNVPNEWLGELPAEWLGIPKRGSIRRKETEVTWQEFLHMNAFHIICARLNTVEGKPQLPTINEAIRAVAEQDEDKGREKVSNLQTEVLKESQENEEEDEMDPLEKIKMRLKNKVS
ncbi:PHD finger protein 24-like isoform X2 [Rhopilema esculentum]